MNWQPIVVGVDGSPESVRAAVLGTVLAEAAHTTCSLVHAAPDYWSATSMPELGVDPEAIDRATVQHARTLVTSALTGHVPAPLLDRLEVRVGRPAVVLCEVAAERHAGLIVLGGKHRHGLSRLAGSTLTHLVRMSPVPVCATDGGSGGIQRVLAAVDLSHAAGPTIEAAERFADAFGAQLRLMHVVEPVPVVPGFPLDIDDDDCFRAAERALDQSVWPLATRPGVDKVVRRGRSAAAIVDEALAWHADLVVVGSHGKGWVDRLMIGSTSERLLQVLPAVTLIVPAHKLETAGAGAGAPTRQAGERGMP